MQFTGTQLTGTTGTSISRLEHWAKIKSDRPALYSKDTNQGPAAWRQVTWKQYRDSVYQVGSALIAQGFQKGECACIFSRNRPELVFAQYGVIAAGGFCSSIYVTNTAEQAAYILEHSQARTVFVEDQTQYDKLVRVRAQLTGVKKVILFEKVQGADPEWTLSFAEFLKSGLGEQKNEIELKKRI